MPKKGGCMNVPVSNRGAWTPEVVDTAPVPRPYLARSEKLPWSKDEVTAERLTRLLQNKYPGIVVEHLNLDRFIDSHTSKMLVTVALNAVGKDAGIPEKLCIKSNFSGLHDRSEEHTSELQSLMSNSIAIFCFNKHN